MTTRLLIGFVLLALGGSPAVSAQSIFDLDVPAGSETPETDALVRSIQQLQIQQQDLRPLAAGEIGSETSAEARSAARAAAEAYAASAATMIIAAGVLHTIETEPPLARPAIVLLMQGQIDYIARIGAPVGLPVEFFYQSVIFAEGFDQLDSSIRVDLVGGYVQTLLAVPEPSAIESAVLQAVDDRDFVRTLADRTGATIGVADLRAVIWEDRIGETIEIQYYDEAAKLIERTVSITGYDPRFGLIIPGIEDNALPVRLKLSRIEFLRFTEEE